ncbi:flavin-containing monooxygenase [Nocardia crassostreae]|uniref:flavin-containing monooxygenase n=1 Tax=Nocardia crassostreae TaxID=53428 RepID=UPI00082ECBE6|nr:NAD(P)/FAD-dependent oxidoreductase [Nocardia crassostreae]
MSTTPDFHVAVIGAGPGGIAAGVKLKKAGIDDFVILERADDVGGSWHENHYPGLGVDIPALAYQYSFARNPNWSRFFPRGAEVQRYHADVAARFGLYPHIRFRTNVEREVWDVDNHLWRLHTTGGATVTARFLISAVGAFIRPKDDPGIPGLADYAGKLQRPSDWDHDYDHTGKRVAVIGTGASSVQIVPAIAADTAELAVFQRTPVWCAPKPDFRMPPLARKVLAVPGLVAAGHGAVLVGVDLVLRVSTAAPLWLAKPAMWTFDKTTIRAYRLYLRAIVRDPDTARRLAPNHGMIAKRPTMSTGYILAFNRDNVNLITTPIDRFTENGIRTRDGADHDFDMIVLTTGYEVFSDAETYRPGTIVGRNGFDLGHFYTTQGLQSYQSVALPALPNRWTLVGPYSWTGTGWHAFIEMTADHAIRAIREATRRRATFISVRPEAHTAYHRTTYTRAAALRYYLSDLNAHVPTYYRNPQGDTTYIRPSGYFQASRATRHFPLTDYHYERLHRPA